MEIIHLVLGKANPQRMNGVNKVVHELATKQAATGMHVEVWGIAKDTEHNYPDRNFTTRIFYKPRNPFSISLELKIAITEKKGKAVFHLHGGFIPAFYTASQWMKQKAIPFITMVHGAYNTLAMKKSAIVKKLYFQFFESKLLNAAAYIHCIGRSEMKGLARIYSNNKSVLIPYGFEMIDNKHLSSYTNEEFIIGFCGRLDVHTKGLNELVDGFSMLLEQLPNAKLWIIGDSSEKQQLQQRVTTLGIHGAVVFHGALFGNEKIEVLNQCNVFATVSRNEGLPAAVLEAAALGLPCLVTKATNIGEAIEQYDAGVVIELTDAKQVFNGLIELYEKTKHRLAATIVSNNAKKMVREHFNWSNTIQQLDIIYQKAFIS